MENEVVDYGAKIEQLESEIEKAEENLNNRIKDLESLKYQYLQEVEASAKVTGEVYKDPVSGYDMIFVSFPIYAEVYEEYTRRLTKDKRYLKFTSLSDMLRDALDDALRYHDGDF